MSNWIERELLRVKASGDLVAIFSNVEDCSRFNAGFIVAVDKEHYLLASVSPQGEPDGFLLRPVDGVWMLKSGGPDLKRLQCLFDDCGDDRSVSQDEIALSQDRTIIDNVISMLHDMHCIAMLGVDVSAELLCGYIEYFDTDMIRMNTVHPSFVYEDGTASIPVRNIDILEWGSLQCKEVARLLARKEGHGSSLLS